jgi:membrane associated rhomboid family serine protease
MIPLGDDNPTRIMPIITWALIAVNVAAFFWELFIDPRLYVQVIRTFGFVPYAVIRHRTYYMFLTSMFLHGGIMHLAGNMLYLYIFGDNVEDLCGHVPYLVFYLICGFAGSLLQLASDWMSTIPSIGASGAISGLLGAYIYLFPNVRIRTAVTFGVFVRLIRMPAYILIGFWFLYQLILGLLAADASVAYWAHVGGFVAGYLLARVLARRREEHPFYQQYYVIY